jgi:dTDP-4-dehydrorhamnose reductase
VSQRCRVAGKRSYEVRQGAAPFTGLPGNAGQDPVESTERASAQMGDLGVREKCLAQREEHVSLEDVDACRHVGAVDAVLEQGFRHEGNRAGTRDPIAEIPVGGERKSLVEPSQHLELVATDRHGAAACQEDRAIQEEELLLDVAFLTIESFVDGIPRGVDVPKAAVGQTDAWVGDEAIHLALELGRHPTVVAVEERKEVSSRGSRPAISGSSNAGVGLPDRQDSVSERFEYCRGVIRGPVIDDDHLERRLRLPERALDGFGQEAGLVVGGDHDRHGRAAGHPSERATCRGGRGPTGILPLTLCRALPMITPLPEPDAPARRWLITGASGLLGQALCRHLVGGSREVTAVRHERAIDVPGVRELAVALDDEDAIDDAIDRESPDVVVHAAGLTNVDRCELDEDAAASIHVEATARLAGAAAAKGAAFVLISTDHLWDGSRSMVSEGEPPSPMNAYARTKAQGEQVALAAHPSALVVRTNFFGDGPPWRPSFSDWVLDSLERGDTLRAFGDVYFSPVALKLLCPLLVELVDLRSTGTLHVAGRERLSKLEFAHRLAAAVGLPATGIVAASVEDVDLGAPRPHDMSLDTSLAAARLGRPLPDLDTSIATLERLRARSGRRGARPPEHRSP